MATEKLSEKEKQVHHQNQQVLYHQKKCEDLKDELNNAQFNLPKSAQTRLDTQEIVRSIRRIIKDSISNMQHNSDSSKYLFESLTELLLNKTIHGGQMLSCSYETFRKYVRQNVFDVLKVLKHMDLHSGVLNFEGVEALCAIESGGQPYTATLIPSTAELQKVAFIVESYA
ncbi:hypothetical protein ACA910_015033 [Epithemia clementina (nom. ined.)]